jgi:hypothetical protein
MKKTLLFSFLICALISFNVRSQSVKKDQVIDTYISQKSVTDDHEFTYVGSPYFNEEFEKGIIYKDDLALANNVGLRYNANRDVFEIKRKITLKNNQAKYLNKTDDISLKIKNDCFVFIPARSDNNVNGYFILMYKGENVSLYKKSQKLFIAGQKAYTSLARNVEPTYKEKEVLYLSDANGKLSELPNSKNGKIKTFNKHNKEVKQYIKEQHLNLNKENNLIKLVKYYDGL